MAHSIHCQTDAPDRLTEKQRLLLCTTLLPLVPQEIVIKHSQKSQSCLGIQTSNEILDIPTTSKQFTFLSILLFCEVLTHPIFS